MTCFLELMPIQKCFFENLLMPTLSTIHCSLCGFFLLGMASRYDVCNIQQTLREMWLIFSYLERTLVPCLRLVVWNSCIFTWCYLILWDLTLIWAYCWLGTWVILGTETLTADDYVQPFSNLLMNISCLFSGPCCIKGKMIKLHNIPHLVFNHF